MTARRSLLSGVLLLAVCAGPQKIPEVPKRRQIPMRGSLVDDPKRLLKISKGETPDIETYGCLSALNHGQWTSLWTGTGVKWTFRGCYDPLGDNWTKNSPVYYFDVVVNTQNALTKPPNPPLAECKKIFDVCKEQGAEFLYEASCTPDKTTVYEKPKKCSEIAQSFTCWDGACMPKSALPENQPDLVVDTIYPAALSKLCDNSIHFKICNLGKSALTTDIIVRVEANGFTVEYLYVVADSGAIAPGACKDIEAPKLLHIYAFGMALDQTHQVTVTVDAGGAINEPDEGNNQKTAPVFAGDDFKYDDVTTCDVSCYDSDGAENDYLFIYGTVDHTYKGTAYSSSDYCLGEANGVYLMEFLCKGIAPQPDGTFTNPGGSVVKNCNEYFLPAGGKCLDGKCVPAKQQPVCFDADGGQAAVKGTLQYTSVDGIAGSETDACAKTTVLGVEVESTQTLIEWLCDAEGKLRLKNLVDCYAMKSECKDGACVPTAVDLKTCQDTDPADDPAIAGTLSYTKLLGEKEEQKDYCFSDYDKVKQFKCGGADGKDPVASEFDCAAVGKGCHDGACVPPNPALKVCQETDAGLDYAKSSAYAATDPFGNSSSGNEHCLPDGKLIEYYCDGGAVKLAVYDCGGEGKVCKGGACVAP